jgi:hypothetical protein
MQNILHRIKAYLYDNPFNRNMGNYIAHVSSEDSLNVKEIAEAAVSRGGADVSVAVMEHSVELWLQEMAYQVCDGFSVNAGWFTASVRVRGLFDSPQDNFDKDKHAILFEFRQGAKLRKELSAVTLDILGIADLGAVIAQVTDMKTGSINDLLTPGRNLQIAGNKIKVVGNEPEVGIRFRAADNPETVYAVALNDIAVNNSRKVVAFIPEMPVGEYKLEISTQFIKGTQLLERPRTAVFDKILTVK